ncbi:hypothetical protein Tco_0913921 [Tanacetum coccineum]
MPGRRALGRRNQRILSPGQYRQEDRDALAARATILASSLGWGVKGQDRHGMNTRARKEEKAPCSKDSEVEDGVGTGSLNYEEKIRMPTFRTAEVDVAENDEALEINLELLEEK